MKNLLVISILFFAVIACAKEPIIDKGKLDPNALISIRPAAGVKSGYLSAKDIVKNTRNISFYNAAISGTVLTRGFADAQRDTVNVRLLMWGIDIISQSGLYVPDFIEGNDFVFRKAVDMYATPPVYDTIAYIPNSVIVNARNQIKTAFADSNYVEVYRLFDVAFTFTPISGAEWRALKKIGQN